MTDEQRNRHLSWKNSYWLVVLLALAIGLFAIASSIGIDWMIHGGVRRVYASDWFEGAAAALLSGVALLRMQARRRELIVHMQIVEDVNHHVRNALTCIVLSTSLREDVELNARVRDACERIDWVLNDVLSQSVDATDLKTAHPTWNAGHQLNRPNPLHHPAQTKNMRN
jgi:hypothetical protein